ncbi:IS3 family transposase [Lutibacter sp. B2]|nr:IS3 family transposase [Lutibacter sp. B2]
MSLSGKGNCYDNVCIESFHSILKREFIYRYTFSSLEELEKGLFKYIEVFYNINRIDM